MIIDSVQGINMGEEITISCEKCVRRRVQFCYQCGVPLCRDHYHWCTSCKQIICNRDECKVTIGRFLKKNITVFPVLIKNKTIFEFLLTPIFNLIEHVTYFVGIIIGAFV